MANVLLATTPVPGHVTPMAVLARRLVERGNTVVWHTGAGFADQVTATGAFHVPIGSEHDWSLRHPHEVVPELRSLTGLDQVRTAFRRLFIDAAPNTLAELEAIVSEFAADVTVANGLVFADRWLHERGGPPSANLATTMYGLYSRDTAPFGPALLPMRGPLGRLRNTAMNTVHRKIVFGPVNRHLDDVRVQVGLPRRGQAVLDSFLSPHLYLQDCVPAFEYPRRDLPPQVHFIGPLLPDPPDDFRAPEWWPQLRDGRPVVLVTQGTVRNEDDVLFAPTFKALADQDVLVIATTAGGASPTRPWPDNVRVEPFLPYAALMPHVSAYVTNGGYGGVQMALAHGVPIVVCGATEDKPEVAARVAWSGVGLRVRHNPPRITAIADAVRAVLDDGRYRTRAQEIAADIARTDAATTGAELIEQLARTGRPVRREPRARADRIPDVGNAPSGQRS
jgi:UDP:flavonoid glycosyltransferase YjiC (YdhE family)